MKPMLSDLCGKAVKLLLPATRPVSESIARLYLLYAAVVPLPRPNKRFAQQLNNPFLQEYLVSKDIAEVRRCLHSLAMPFFHHEAVKQALLMALDDPAKQGPVLQMLGQLADSSDISGSQMLRVRDCCWGTSLAAIRDWGVS